MTALKHAMHHEGYRTKLKRRRYNKSCSLAYLADASCMMPHPPQPSGPAAQSSPDQAQVRPDVSWAVRSAWPDEICCEGGKSKVRNIHAG